MNHSHKIPPILLFCLLFLITACAANQVATTPTTESSSSAPTKESPVVATVGPFGLSSPAFKDGEEMGDKYIYKMGSQCNGENYSPALEWTGAPIATESFAITILDPDGGNWVHWVQFNIPAGTNNLPEVIGGPDIGIKGRNDFYSMGYGGPCPPGGTHRYIFTLYALDTLLDLPEGTKLKDLLVAMDEHILAETQLTGLRTK